MTQPTLSKADLARIVEEISQVFDPQDEILDSAMDKKLIINACVAGAFVSKKNNPHLPISTKDVAKNVEGAYKAGATIWHFHPKNPETGSQFIPVEERVKLHKEWCDAVFEVAPDIITCAGALYVAPPVLTGRNVEKKSILAETRMSPLVDQLIKLGPKNRYIEMGISLATTDTLGPGTSILVFNNKAGVISDVKYLQSKGIGLEITPFNHVEFHKVKEWVIDTGIAKNPFVLDIPLGVHNTPMNFSGMEAFEYFFTYVRMLPKNVLWQVIMGGRYWMPLTVIAIILGADIVRVGMEDACYMYPHKDGYIEECRQAVEAIAGIARFLGREIATPKEAREILGLPQIKK